MLYLMSEKGQRTVKVGFTSNPAKRINDYATHSTVAQFIDWKEGTKADEKNWHEFMDAMGMERVDPERERSEWFFLPDFIDKRKLMSEGFAFLEKALWNNMMKNL